ncbi:MAG: lantibiotic dehydratase [Kofleriaceae bacterium]
MGSEQYQIAPIFAVRLTGVPFDVLDGLATVESSRLARELLAFERDLAAATQELWASVRASALSRTVIQRIGRALKSRRVIEDLAGIPEHGRYTTVLEACDRAHAMLTDVVVREELVARTHMWTQAKRVLPDFLVLESESAYDGLIRATADPTDRSSDTRRAEQHFALYLQRVCARNETISRFGPVAWARTDPMLTGVRLNVRPGIADRSVLVERWVVATIVEAINGDPDIRRELCPRVHPAVRRAGERVTREDLGTDLALDPEERALLDRCDGRSPAWSLDVARVARLADAGAVVWRLELIAWDDNPLRTLTTDVQRWRPGPSRDRWLAPIESLGALAAGYARDLTPSGRRRITSEVSKVVTSVGGQLPESARTKIYSAHNAISENCSRDGDIAFGASILDGLVRDLTPWLDLFLDAVSLGVGIGYDHVHALIRATPRRDGCTNLAALVATSEASGESLRNEAPMRWGREAFQEVVRDFNAVLSDRQSDRELALTAADCHVLRRTRDLPLIREGSWPSADLLLAASSPEAVESGDYRWVVGELHYMLTLLHHASSWCCPDRAALRDAFRDFSDGRSWILPGRKGFLRTPVHVSFGSMMELVPDGVYAATERAPAEWKQVPPSDIEIVVLEAERDIRARHRDSGEDLGSLVRVPWVFQGISTFTPFERVPHAPRLMLGRTVVQRENWRVRREEVGDLPLHGVSPKGILAVERLRADRGIPRWVFVRPPRSVLERTEGLSAQDKEAKPIYIDLESYLFIDIFLRRLHRHGELEVVEMLPAPDELLWREPDGRYCFELRTMCPPAR